MDRPGMPDRRRFLLNRVVILLAVAAILAGLALSHWDIVLLYARLI